MTRAETPWISPAPTGKHVLWAALGLVALALGAVTGIALAFWAGLGVAGVSASAVVLASGLSLAVLWFGLIKRCGWTVRDLGFCRPRHSLWHLLWWIPATILLGGIGALLLGTLFGLTPDGGASTTDTAIEAHWSIVPLVALGASVFVPLVEEIIFRRVLLDWLLTKMPTALAAIIVIVAFTIAHISPTTMVYIVYLSTSLVLARLWFKSLWASLLIHAANNGMLTTAAIAALLG